MPAELRPLTLGELLDRTFSYYRDHFWTFVGIAAPAQAVVVATTLLVMFVGLTSLTGFNPRDAKTPVQIFARLIPLYLSTIINAFVSCFAMTVAAGATSAAVSKIHLGVDVSIADAYRGLKGQVGRLAGLFGMFILISLGAYVVMIAVTLLPGAAVVTLAPLGIGRTAAGVIAFVLVLLGAIGGTILAFRLALRYTLAIPSLVLERLGPVKALGRSSRLAKGSLGRIFLACLLMFLIVMVVTFTCETPFWAAGAIMGLKLAHNPIWLSAPASIAGGVGAAFGYPLLLIVLPLFYYDARVRKEGYDLQVMMPPEGVESRA
jgi:hypothetical protein